MASFLIDGNDITGRIPGGAPPQALYRAFEQPGRLTHEFMKLNKQFPSFDKIQGSPVVGTQPVLPTDICLKHRDR